MKAFRCRACDNPLYFENSVCVSCGTALGYSRAERAIVPVDEQGRYVDDAGLVWHVCRNLDLSGCTWLAPLEGGQCFACDLTRTRPNDGDAEGLEKFPAAERAKRHLVVELDTLGFPVVGKQTDPENGLAFDLLSSTPGVGNEHVVIGHEDGSSPSTWPRATRPTASGSGPSSTSPTARCSATSATRSGTTTSGSWCAAS